MSLRRILLVEISRHAFVEFLVSWIAPFGYEVIALSNATPLLELKITNFKCLHKLYRGIKIKRTI